MPARVTLSATTGRLAGRSFVFEGRVACIVGRDTECGIRLPEDDPTVSRNHCLLDINPPAVTIRDFGSMNGTHVNGEKIGQRAAGLSPSDSPDARSHERDLAEGDLVGLGETTLRVSIVAPASCPGCGAELAAGEARCASCRAAALAAPAEPQETLLWQACAGCGREMRDAAGDDRGVLCEVCRADPRAVVGALVAGASSGGRAGLVAIEGYTIERELGRGGMGAVFLARRTATGELAALKVMLPRVAVRPQARDMFLREIENMKTLRHRNIVRMKDHGDSHGTFFMTLEYCAGGSAEDLMARRGGRLGVDEGLGIMLQVLDGLEYAHTALVPNVARPDGSVGQGQGLVHRDVKPVNIFLTAAENPYVAKVADYGLSKAFDNAGLSGQTLTGAAAGSPCFMPRQQLINYKYAKPEVDVWAAAASFYYMVTGRHPREYPAGMDPWRATLQNNPVPIRDRTVSVGSRLAEVIDAALVDRPALRFKTADELRRAIQGAV